MGAKFNTNLQNRFCLLIIPIFIACLKRPPEQLYKIEIMRHKGVGLMRENLVYGLLRSVKTLSRCFYRFDISWIGQPAGHSWDDIRLVAFLNHTSLFEPLFVGWFPNEFLKRIATKGLMPVADKALQRPVMGYFFNLVAGNVVPISRMKDRTWLHLLNQVHSDSMVIIMPEGRMMRRRGEVGIAVTETRIPGTSGRDLVRPDILDIGVPSGLAEPVLGARVRKSGRTTGLTEASVLQTDVTANVIYGNQKLRFINQVMTGPLSRPGDSGSAVVDEQNRLVGVMFSGSDYVTLATPITYIMAALNVEVIIA